MVKLLTDDKRCNAHFLLVKDSLQRRAAVILQHGYIRKDNKIEKVDGDCADFLQSLQEDDFLRAIICSLPNELSGLIDEITTNYPDFIVVSKPSYKIIYNIFINHGYDSPVFKKLDFINNIGRDTCLYCNRNYIYTLDRADNLKPEIDHFYPKTKYPFLGLSYYNLIPSCELCNGTNCKHQEDPKDCGLTNPYLIKDDDFVFTYKVRTINVVNPLSSLDSVDVCFSSKLQPHLNVFKLDKLYKKHTDHVLELILKSQLTYSKSYRRYLKSYDKLNFNDHQINRMIIGNYATQEDIHKRPLAKLYQDIAKELGII